MPVAYSLTPELRVKLKAPIGTLIRGPYAETMKILKEIVRQEKPTFMISVGDVVSKSLAENSFFPHVSIVDNRIMRRNIPPVPLRTEKTINIKNPRGIITKEAVEAIQEAVDCDCSAKIVVDGEEDLLTLIAILYSPENTFVVYGQPHEGIVVVKVTQEKKNEIAAILRTMEDARKAK
jgi:uncharacterized protein (UPF0218 family)